MTIQNPKQVEAALEMSAAIVSALATGDELHAGTAVAAASRMAGTMLLHSTGLPISAFRPGSNIQSDSIDRQGQALMGAVSEALAAMPLHLDTSTPDYFIPEANMPLMELRATQVLLQSPMQTILSRHRLSEEQGALAAALAAAQLIQQCAGVLDPHVGRAIATIGIAEASKTVPVV